MNTYEFELTLDLDCRNTLPVIRAGQYDKGRRCLVHVTANNQPFSASGCTVVIKGKRRDKTVFSEDCSVDNSGNVILELSESILSTSGFAYAKIVLSDATRNYSTQIFVIDVDGSFEGEITELESFSVLNSFINKMMLLFGLEQPAEMLSQYVTSDNLETALAAKADYTLINDIDNAVENGKLYRAYDNTTALYYTVLTCSNQYNRIQLRLGYDSKMETRKQTYVNDEWTAWSAWVAFAKEATTLAGYGILDSYTKTESDARYLRSHQDISGKVDKTQKVAGVDLQDDITVAELKTALSVPTKTSELTNDSGFLTSSDISGKVDKTQKVAGVDLQDDITAAELQTALSVPTKTSDLTNDSGFLTQHQDISDRMYLASEYGVDTSVSQTLPNDIPIGQVYRVSDGQNVTWHIRKDNTTDLEQVHLMTKAETYTKSEIDTMIGDVESLLALV